MIEPEEELSQDTHTGALGKEEKDVRKASLCWYALKELNRGYSARKEKTISKTHHL